MMTEKQNGRINLAFDDISERPVETNGKIVLDAHLTNGSTAKPDPQIKPPDRGTWGNNIEFLMSCIAMSVGLGNVWRFPFTAYENGGGAFLIPYLIVLLVIGRPLYYLEMCIGQFTGLGSVKTFAALAPVLRGLGYSQVLGNLCVATYYCCLMAITLFYLINSFTSSLPWSKCQEEWASLNVSCVPSNQVNVSIQNSISSSELWFTKAVLREKTQIEDGLGTPEWRLTICLLAAWIITFTVTMRGVQSSGKASYFLALFPYVILFTLLVKALTLEGSISGIQYFIKPQWNKLLESDVWYSAVSQCFFSLAVGSGPITMYASYNKFTHNVYRDALIVSIIDTLTSLLAGATIFGILGNLAHKLGVEISDVVKSGGAGLAFISYPEAIAKFDSPWSSVFAILFFFMLFVLGTGSLVALQGSLLTVIMDNFPHLKTWHVSGGVALTCFLIGLVYVTPGGQHILTLVDYFGGSFIFFVIATLEMIVVVWWYGLENFCQDIEFMLKRKVGIYWRISWAVVAPVVLAGILIYHVFNFNKPVYAGKPLPDNVLAFGWIIFGVGLLQPLIWWIIYLAKTKNLGLKESVKKSFSHEGWGPKDPETWKRWREFKKSAAGEGKRSIWSVLVKSKRYDVTSL